MTYVGGKEGLMSSIAEDFGGKGGDERKSCEDMRWFIAI